MAYRIIASLTCLISLLANTACQQGSTSYASSFYETASLKEDPLIMKEGGNNFSF